MPLNCWLCDGVGKERSAKLLGCCTDDKSLKYMVAAGAGDHGDDRRAAAAAVVGLDGELATMRDVRDDGV